MNSPREVGRINLEPYPPRNADEVRISRQMERIEHKLDTIFAKLMALEKIVGHLCPDKSNDV